MLSPRKAIFLSHDGNKLGKIYVIQIFNMLIVIGLLIWVSLQSTQWWHHLNCDENIYTIVVAQGVRMFCVV